MRWAIGALAGVLFGCAAAPVIVTGSGPGTLAPSAGAEACVTSAAEVCFNARDDNCNGLFDEGCGQATGLVQFLVAWDTPGADVDLLVQDPKGELVEVATPTESGLVKEKDCPGRTNECDGKNVENVFLEADHEIARGVYRIRIRLEKAGSGAEPVNVQFGARLGPKTHSERFRFEREAEERTLELPL